MKTRIRHRLVPTQRRLLLLMLVALQIGGPVALIHGQATSMGSFTYQGRLADTGAPVTGLFDLSFTVFGTATGGSALAPTLLRPAWPVTNGLFTATLAFAGLNTFDGTDRWLEITVKRTGAAGTAITLTPRQQVTATPYAIAANRVTGSVGASQLTGTVGSGNLSGTYAQPVLLTSAANVLSGNGAGLTGVNAATLGGLTSAAFWKANGNATANPTNGAFVGTTDDFPIELRVNNARALRLEPNATSPNVIGGSSFNAADPGVFAATIGGGGDRSYPNRVAAPYATVVGGGDNFASGLYSIAGGSGGRVSGQSAVGLGHYAIASGAGAIALGVRATASGDSALATGESTTASGNAASTMGKNTLASGNFSVALGESTVAEGLRSFALGLGTRANSADSIALGAWSQANHANSFVWGDGRINPLKTTGDYQFLINATGGVGINTAAPQAPLNVNGSARIDALGIPYSEGLSLNFPRDMDLFRGGFGGIHFHKADRGAAYSETTIKWGIYYNYAPELGISGGGLAFTYANQRTALYLAPFGGVGIGTTDPGALLQVGNATCNGSIWLNSSDRNAKENFKPVDVQAVLEKVVALPLSEWNYKTDATSRHIGPMAQDFSAAFHTGSDDTRIATVDADGVALAAIQGLYRKLTETLEARDAEIADLKQRLTQLEAQRMRAP